MTASAQYNYNRRNSSTTPYSIPSKHIHHQQHTSHQNGPINSPPLSTSVPTLSREFVVRRISEGETGRLKEELRCEACGKGYKHISSLAKHLWEHTPEWNVTKKLLISKHQQVQLLEAASILVGMNDVPSNPSSRRNSLVDDPRHLETHAEHTKPSFKNSYIPESYETSNYQRSNSISHYPPSIEYSHNAHNVQQSPAIGGYLDNHRDSVIKSRSNSIFTSSHYGDLKDDDDHILKSPPSSYKQPPSLHTHPEDPKSASILTPSSTLTSPQGVSPNSEDDSFEEEVIGKME